MAGDWIPMRIDLPDDPAVISIASACAIDTVRVVGLLHKLWGWANRHLRDGATSNVTSQWVDSYLGTPGFAAAMQKAGWLQARSVGIAFIHFDRWNSSPAKKRILTALRVQKTRRAPCNATSVTEPLPEKRREENKNLGPPYPPKFEHSAEGLAQAWVFYCTRRRNGSRPETLADMVPQFGELLRHQADGARLLAEIESPDRDRNEHFWEFEKRMRANRGTDRSGGGVGPATRARADPAKIETYKSKTRRIGGAGPGAAEG